MPFATRPTRASGSFHSEALRGLANVSIQATTAGAASWVRLRERVLGAAAALRRRQPPTFCGDRTALHAIRRCDLDRDRAVAALDADLVHLGGTQVDPHLCDILRNTAFDADVIRLVVACLVPGCEHGRQLVERQLAVR